MTNKKVVEKYVNDIIKNKTINCKEKKLEAKRYLNDIKKYHLNVERCDKIIKYIENFFIHEKGSNNKGVGFANKPFVLEPWQKYIIFNVVGLEDKKTGLPKYKESFIFVPRKQGKTTFMMALVWAIAMLDRLDNSRIIITSASLRQSCISFNYMKYVLQQKKLFNKGRTKDNEFNLKDNNNEHSITSTFDDNEGKIELVPMASDVTRQDGENCSLVIADEIHAFKQERQYTIFREALAVYSRGHLFGITTAGDNINGFCYSHLKFCQKILRGEVKQEKLFIFICKADEDEKGNVDYTNPIEHQKANPNYGITVNPQDLLDNSNNAEHNPLMRSNFLQKNLNVFTSSNKAYFNLGEFKHSNAQHNFTLNDDVLKTLKWYGGVDLAVMHDLTAMSLVAQYKDVLLVWTHAFFPRVNADMKAKEDNIPLHGWRDDGNLTMTSGATLEYSDVVDKFKEMRSKGFKIKQIGYDEKFSPIFVQEMIKAKFKIEFESQLHTNKSKGFKLIEKKAKDDNLYYFNNEAYEYCLANVSGIEKNDGFMQYEKVDGASSNNRIDLFDASVFATMRLLNDYKNANRDFGAIVRS